MANFGTVGIIAQARNFNQTLAAMGQFRRQVGVLSGAQKQLVGSNAQAASSARSFASAITGGFRSLIGASNSSQKLRQEILMLRRQYEDNAKAVRRAAQDQALAVKRSAEDQILASRLLAAETEKQQAAAARRIAETGVRRKAADEATGITRAAEDQRVAMQRATEDTIANISRARFSLIDFGRAAIAAFSTPGRLLMNFGQAIRNLGTNIKGLGNEIAAVGFRLGFLISLPLVSFFNATVNAAADFENTLTQIVNLTDFVAQDLGLLRDELLRLAPILGQTPAELAQGAFTAASAGITDTAQVLDILTASAKASAIGLGETNTVARAVTGVMLAYGEAAGSAAEITDVLTAIVDQGNLEIDQLAGEIGRVVGPAAQAGVSFEELGAFVATYTQSSISSSEAITSLRGTLAAIIKPSAGAKEALAEYGLTIEDVRASIQERGLPATLIGLTQAISDTGEATQQITGVLDGNVKAFRAQGDAVGVNIEALSRIFPNIRAFAGVSFVAGEAAGEFAQNLEAIRNSAGLVEEGFTRVSRTTGFQMEQFRASMQVLGITIGSILLPAVNAFIQKAIPFIGGLQRLAEMNPKLVLLAGAITLVVAALAPALVIFGLLVSSIGSIIAVVGGLISAIGALLLPLGAIGLVLATVAGLFVLSARKIAQKGGAEFASIGQQARGWGRNIAIQLARGIAEATIAVVNALISIGRVISRWLAPGSPPMLLPELNEWGAAWIGEILKGFTQADFSIFNDLSSMMESFFRSLTGAFGEDDLGLIPAILGSRSAIAEALNQVRETGTVTQDVLDQISGNFGQTSQAIEDYIVSVLHLAAANQRLADAQQRLNDIEEHFSNIIDPLSEELDDIHDLQQTWSEDQRIAELNAIIAANPNNLVAIQRARAELRAIQLQRQIRAQEDLRDAAVDTAEAEVDAAQDAVDAAAEQVAIQRAIIDAQIRNNELIQEQIAALEQLNDTLDDIGGGGGLDDLLDVGGGGLANFKLPLSEALQGAKGEIQSLADTIGLALDDLQVEFDEFSADMGQLIEDMKAPFAPLFGEGGLIDQLTDVWSDVFINGKLAIAGLGEGISKHGATIIGFFIGLGAAFLYLKSAAIAAGITTILTNLGTWFLTVGGFSGILVALRTAIMGVFTAASLVTGALTFLLVAAPVLMGMAIDKYGSFTEVLRQAGLGALFLAASIGGLIALFGQFVTETIVAGMQSVVIPALIDLGEWLRKVPGWLEEVFAKIGEWVLKVILKFQELYDALIGHSIIPDLIIGIQDWFGKELPTRVLTAIESFVSIVGGAMLEAGGRIMEKIVEGVGNALQSLTDALVSVLTAAWNAAVGQLPSFEFPTPGGGGMGSGGSTGGGGMGSGSSAGGSDKPPQTPMSRGGLVRGGIMGRDSVAAMLMPGELVIPTRAVRGGIKGIMAYILGFRNMQQRAAELTAMSPQQNAPVRSGASVEFIMNINSTLDVALLEHMVRRIIRTEFV